MPKFKSQIPNPKHKYRFWYLSFVIGISFVICHLSFVTCLVYALNLDKIKVNFLNGDYKAAILEGEKVLATNSHSTGSDELYYILGLSYIKDGNYLRASDIFEIILKEFKESKFQEGAKLGLGNTYFLRQDFDKAQDIYQDLIKSSPQTKFKAQGYYRLSQIAFKKGDAQLGKEYLAKLTSEFPENIEAKLNRDLYPMVDLTSDFYYTVQVGSFSSNVNAQNLMQKLAQNGYPAYFEEIAGPGTDKMYRVRVGKLKSRQEALELESKLSHEGYPTKICP